MEKSDFGDRMKGYESSFRAKLPQRLPVIVRYDGKSFHSYTKGCESPFDQKLIDALNETAIYVCKNVQNCKIAYLQSDETSLLLCNDAQPNTESYFDNNIQKIVSVIASMASSYLTSISSKVFGQTKLAHFDARTFILPKEEVNNYFLWRQQDSSRNSIQMVARAHFSHKQCNDKTCNELQEMLFQEKGINWNNLPTDQKRGRCIIKRKITKPTLNPKTNETVMAERNEWVVDNEIPIFHQDRHYIDQYLVYPSKDMDWSLEPEEMSF
jgi:tRNA(His) guanylyltransferase